MIKYLESQEDAVADISTHLAGEAVTAGDWVSFDWAATEDGDVTITVYKADSNSSPVRTPVGVAVESASAGARVRVCVAGPCDANTSDNGAAGMAIGALLQITSTAGQADAASAASAEPVCGVLTETVGAAAGAGVRRVFVFRRV